MCVKIQVYRNINTGRLPKMITEEVQQSILEKAIYSFKANQNFHICIHDTSGILHTNPLLSIEACYKKHSSSFCQNAKLTATGLRFCLRCKAASLRKAIVNKETYLGQCYLGLYEFVRPVIINEKMVCVIYLGNLLLEEKKQETVTRIKRISQKTGASSRRLIESLESVKRYTVQDTLYYTNMLDILEYLIKSNVSTQQTQKRQDNSFPIYSRTNHWAIQLIQNYILEFYNKNIKLSQLASLFFLNPDYLCRLFHKETGMSFSEYMNNTRINQAKSLLKLTDNKILDISIEVGFSNVTYFNRLFKNITGVSPREYRNSNISIK